MRAYHIRPACMLTLLLEKKLSVIYMMKEVLWYLDEHAFGDQQQMYLRDDESNEDSKVIRGVVSTNDLRYTICVYI